MTQILQLNESDLREILAEVVAEVIANVQPAALVPPPDRIDDINEAAREAGLSVSKVYKLTSSGEFPCKKYGARKLVFSRQDIEAWREGRTTIVSEGRGLKSITEAARRRAHARKA